MPDERLESSRDDGVVTFVIRIRAEGTEGEGPEPGWVAHVTNVLEQSERYVRGLGELADFLEAELTRMGIVPQVASEDPLRSREELRPKE